MASLFILYAIALALAVAGPRVARIPLRDARLFDGDLHRPARGGLRRPRPVGRTSPDAAPRATPAFERNDAAVRSLGLTPRECEILGLLASGRSTKEIARQLDISPNTAKTHLARIYEKLEVQRRTQAIHKARELALIP